MATAKTTTPTPEPTPDPAPEVTPDPTAEVAPEETNPAVIAPREYAPGYGWDVGQQAPEDAFRALGGDYATPVGPVVHTHPGDYARQIVAKGGLITDGVKRELDAANEQPADSDTTNESAGA